MTYGQAVLVNNMLCFYVTGLSERYKFSVAFFCVQTIKAEQLPTYTMDKLKRKQYIIFHTCWPNLSLEGEEENGLWILHIATGDAKTIVGLYKLIAGNDQTFCI